MLGMKYMVRLKNLQLTDTVINNITTQSFILNPCYGISQFPNFNKPSSKIFSFEENTIEPKLCFVLPEHIPSRGNKSISTQLTTFLLNLQCFASI